MRITDVKVVNLFYEYPERVGFRYAGGVCTGRLTSLVRVETDEGVEGIGSAYSNPDMVRCVVEGKWAQRAEARLAFDVRDDGASLGYVRLARGKASLVRVSAEGEQQVGEPAGFRPPKQCEVTVHRREGRVRVIVDRRVLLDVPWVRPLGGSVGAGSNGKGLTVSDVLLQPVATPDVEDGFARGTEEMGSWEAVSGRWANTMITVPKAEQ